MPTLAANAIDAASPFELLEEAGAGGMGTVYRARDRASSELLAVKLLRGVADATRFALEAEILSKLQHPAIVGYRRHGVVEDGTPYIAMEWIEGKNLEERLRDGNLSVEEALRIGRSIADALVAAHAAGVIHRDLKPTNVLLAAQTGAVKIVDFGVARIGDSTGLTHTGQAVGSAGYMSPEQARGVRVDARADLFALGCLLFRCLAGRRPFEGADLLQFATSLVLQDAPALRSLAPHVPPAVEALVARLLEKEPEGRPDSALHVLRAIDRILVAEDATHPAVSVGARSEPMRPVSARSMPWLPPPSSRLGLPDEEPTVVHGKRFRSSVPPPPVVTSISGTTALTIAPALTRRSPRRRMWPLAIVFATILLALVFLRRHSLIDEAAAGAALPTEEPARPPPVRSAFEHACRTWAAVIAQGQTPEGSFAGEVRSDPTAWDTGQQLFALTQAKRACDAVAPEVIWSGVRALDQLRTLDKHAARKKPEERSVMGLTPSNAWALLAFDGAGRAARGNDDEELRIAAERSRADILAARNPDGGFRHNPVIKGGSTPYSTLLATWALISDAESHARADVGETIKGALAWLARDVTTDATVANEPGFTEQLAWLLGRSAKVYSVDPAALSTLSSEVVKHCHLDGTACTAHATATGKIKLNGDAGRVVTLWAPWVTLASYELMQQPSSPSSGTAGDLRLIARWGAAELGRSTEPLALIPEYKLSEYLMVVSSLLLAEPGAL